MYILPDGDPCSGHNTMLGALLADDGLLLSHEDLDDFDGAVEMPEDDPLMEIILMVPCMDDDDL